MAESPLVVPEAQPLLDGQGVAEAQQAWRSSPQAVFARERSRTEFEHLSTVGAVALSKSVFPAVVGKPAGGLPSLPAGQRLGRYTSDHSVQVDLGGARHGLIESLQPIAIEPSPGRWAPISLALAGVGGVFEPKVPLVGVRIPARLADGVELSSSGVSLTPVDPHDRDLGGAPGTPDGAGVLYANTQRAADTLARPTTGGFDLDSLLRGVEGPRQLYFRVGLPAGARLVRAGDNSQALLVVAGRRTLALIAAPSAEDAEGRAIPVSMGVTGDVVSVKVEDLGEVRYPVEVDPTVEENVGGVGKILLNKTWGFDNTDDPTGFHDSERSEGVADTIYRPDAGGGTDAFFYYKTQGESKIYSLTATTSSEGNGSEKVENVLGVLNPHTGALEAQHSWIGAYSPVTTSMCTGSDGRCETGSVNSSNDGSEAVYKQTVREPDEYQVSDVSALANAKIGIVQTASPSATWDTTDTTIDGQPNAMIPGKWVNTYSDPTPSLGLDAFDPGVGILRESWSSPQAPGWGEEVTTPDADGGVQRPECEETACGGSPRPITWQLKGLPEGEDTVDGTVEDGVGLKTTAAGVVKVDYEPPYSVHLVGLPENHEVGFGRVRLFASATDGSGETPSSGVASIALFIDGKEIGHPNGSCSPGPCTATGEWVIDGEEYAAGKHEVALVATDYAGNQTPPKNTLGAVETTITFVSSESKSVGPGSVNVASGAFKLDDADVSVPGAGASLAVERSYDSRDVGEDNEGPFGPQWQGLSFAGSQKLTKVSTGGVILTAASGQSVIFTREGSGFIAPAGDSNLTLEEESATVFRLSDQRGDVTKFTIPEGGSGSVLTPSSREEPGSVGATKYTFQTVAGVTEPTQALAPTPGVSCTTLVRGCRALGFSYASKTTASGEAPGEWGEYAGRLMKISFTAYNPAAGEMQTTPVAQYAYDRQGRLRAEWDPEISPALKTTYGYDAEGHVTAVTPPGQQPWLLHYGTTEQDPTSGRLLSVTRPSATTAFGNDLAPAAVEAPKLSTPSPVQGAELTVSTGKWSNEPLSYSYQWERCSSTGGECAAMPGATNQTYTVRYGDEEHALAVLVTATSAGGSTTTSTAVSAFVPYTVFSPAYDASLPKEPTLEDDFKSPSYVAYTRNYWSEPRVFVTDTGDDRVAELNAEGERVLSSFGSAGSGEEQLNEPTGIAAPTRGRVWVADSGNRRRCSLEENDSSEYDFGCYGSTKGGPLGGISPDYQSGGEGGEELVAVDGEHSAIECINYCPNEAGDYISSFGSTGIGDGQFEEPAGIAYSPVNYDIYVVDSKEDRVQYFSDEEGHFGEYLGQFGEPGSKPGQFDEPEGIAIDSRGNVWVVDSGNGRVEVFSPTGQFKDEFGEKSAKAVREEREAKIHAEEEHEPAKQRKKREKREAKEKHTKEQREEKQEEKEHKHQTRQQKEEKEAGPGTLTRPIGIALESEESGRGPYEGESLWVVDSGDNRVTRWRVGSRPPEPPLPPPTPPQTGSSAVWTIDYHVPVSGEGAPYPLGSKELAEVHQSDDPVEGTAIFPPDEPMGWPAKDYKRASIVYLDSKGHTVNTAAPGGAITTAEYNSNNDLTRTLSADDRAEASRKGGDSALELDTENTYNSEGTELQSTTGPEHTVRLANGEESQARKVSRYFYEEGAPAGGPYDLVTKRTNAAENMAKGGEEGEVRTTLTSYAGQKNLGWKLHKPTSVTADPGGLGLEHTTLYELETGNIIETRQPANAKEKSAHATETTYYTAGANAKAEVCGEHPEWADLPCQTRPAKQPETAGLPSLTVTTIKKYNIWDEPETTEETAGGKTRTKTETYDAAGRLTSSSSKSEVGTPTPTVTYEYNPENGALASQVAEGKKIASGYNTLGQLIGSPTPMRTPQPTNTTSTGASTKSTTVRAPRPTPTTKPGRSANSWTPPTKA